MMGDTEKNQKPPAVPDRQRDKPESEAATTPLESRLNVARRFLEEEEVKNASRDKKAEFLRIKGLGDTEIEALLEGKDSEPASPVHLPFDSAGLEIDS
jgi:hypothetical protein